MKIKEAARETGLTEKAIRFYEAKRLVTPKCGSKTAGCSGNIQRRISGR